jgi:hypothetical protein
MLQVGFEPMNPVLERAKKVHAIDRAATAIGNSSFMIYCLPSGVSVCIGSGFETMAGDWSDACIAQLQFCRFEMLLW